MQHAFLDLPKFGSGKGLARVEYLLTALGVNREQLAARSIVVTGSNGKGSTSRIASSLLCALGIKTGLFTSPHLYRFHERFRINDTIIEDETLLSCMDQVMQAIRQYQKTHDDAVGGFEAQFVLAAKWFCDSNLDAMVFEAGIGGRFDPVQIAKSRVVGLVSLDLEHTELLGNSLTEIALDKMDAAAVTGTVICGKSCLQVKKEMEEHARQRQLKLAFIDEAVWRLRAIQNGIQRFDLHMQELTLKNLSSALAGRHQLNNHAVAAHLCAAFLKTHQQWDAAAARKYWPDAIAQVYWPGRLEKIHESPAVYIDVGHTPEGIKLALDGFRALTENSSSLLVIGSSYNKKADEMVSLLAPYFDLIVCTAAYHKGLPAAEIEKQVKLCNPSASTITAPTIEEAAQTALHQAANKGLNIYVAGGLFVAIEFAHCLKGCDPKALRFF